MIRTWVFIVFFSCFGVYALVGQATRQFVFSHYGTENSLPTNRINDMAQDTQGFYWLATLDGLVRFDGIRSKVFKSRKNSTNTVPFSNVVELRADRHNRIWLLHSNYETGYFNPTTWRFTPVPVRPQSVQNGEGVKHFVSENSEAVFLSVHQEILVYDELERAFVPAVRYFPHKPERTLFGFWEHPGTHQYGLISTNEAALYNPASGTLQKSGTASPNQVPWLNHLAKTDGIVHYLFDSKQRMWTMHRGHDGFVFDCYDMAAQRFVFRNLHHAMSSNLNGYWYKLQEFSGTIWVSGLNFFAWWDEAAQQFVHIPSAHPTHKNFEYNDIFNLYEDHEHNIWICTDKNGLYRFNPTRTWFNNINFPKKNGTGVSDGSPMALLPELDGSVLVSVWGEGFYRMGRHWEQLELDIPDMPNKGAISMWDVCLDRDSIHAWFVGQPGVYRYNRHKRRGTYYNPKVLEGRTIRNVEQDPQGNLWFGTQGMGVFKWDHVRGETDFEQGLYKIDHLPINKPVNHITIDSRGWVWVATGFLGLYVIDSKTDQLLFHFSNDVTDARFNIPEKGISQVLEYNDSIMVFGTSSEVFQFNVQTHKLHTIQYDENLNSLIASMRRDRFGNIWIGTLSNLYRFHPYKQTTLTLGREDGILDDVFTLNSHYELPDGRMVFGADHSLIVFDPVLFKPHANTLKVRITDISIGNHAQSVDSLLRRSTIELGPNDNAIAINFSTLSFDTWHNVQYMIEGLDPKWVFADKDFRAAYNYLPPGTYRFLVRTINSEHETSPVQHPFSIKVYPPFYRSWWFLGLLLLFAAALLYWYDQERLRRRAAIDGVRNKIAEDLHNEVNTALQKINILSEMANMKAEDDPQKTKQYIHQIHSKSNDVIDAMDNMLWGISPKHDNMQSTVRRMEEWVAILNGRFDTAIDLLIDPAVALLQLDMQVRYGAFLLFRGVSKDLVTVCPQGYHLHVGINKKHLQLLAEYTHEDYATVALNNLLYRPELSQRAAALHANWQLEERKKGFAVLISIPISPSSA